MSFLCRRAQSLPLPLRQALLRGPAALLRHLAVALLSCLFALSGAAAFAAEPRVAVTVAQSEGAFIIDATMDVPVPPGTAWEVLTDFDHMTSILVNLKSSKVASRDGNTWVVRQDGVATFGPLSFAFASEREIRLEPMQRIKARNLSGTVKRMESDTRIIPLNPGVQISYHAEIVPGSLLARMFGVPFVRHEVEDQFHALIREMLRRHAGAEQAGKTPG